jgi:hypothetical protein
MPDLATEDAGRPCDLGRTIAHHSKVFHDSMKVASYGPAFSNNERIL